jgi:hypothetical protein
MDKESINKRLENIEIETRNIATKIEILDDKKFKLYEESLSLRKELQSIEAKENKSQCIDFILNKYSNIEYMGKANGKTETSWGNIYAKCSCDEYLELFEGSSGIGTFVIGVCPKCKCEIDFTDYGQW